MSSKEYDITKRGPENYGRWKIEITDAPTASNLYNIASGIEVKPLEPPGLVQSWIERDARAKFVIRKTL
jgi:hypothetical protein